MVVGLGQYVDDGHHIQPVDQWRNGEHFVPPSKSGFGPPSWILLRVGTWWQSGFGPPIILGLPAMWGLRGSTLRLGTGEYFPSLQSHGKIVEEIGGVAIYCPFGEFRRANSYCHLYGAQGLGQRQAYS
ncbi:uncharacterized protein TNCV_5056881 [Trichonephila clavipes]|nr:uncharacterized protein TNCV_5056881 [Trichonephila clavipes]